MGKQKHFKIGDEVYLTNTAAFIGTHKYPVLGSSFECKGTIVSKNNDMCFILWFNGDTNELAERNLLSAIEIDSKPPYKSIW